MKCAGEGDERVNAELMLYEDEMYERRMGRNSGLVQALDQNEDDIMCELADSSNSCDNSSSIERCVPIDYSLSPTSVNLPGKYVEEEDMDVVIEESPRPKRKKWSLFGAD